MILAADLKWDTDCLRDTAGPLTIVVDNRDDGQNHNVHLPTAKGSPATDLAQCPSEQELDVDLGAGSYEYVCDIHPNMVGTLTVEIEILMFSAEVSVKCRREFAGGAADPRFIDLMPTPQLWAEYCAAFADEAV